jgi:transposase-like protein
MSMEQVRNGLEKQGLPERWSAERKMDIDLRWAPGQDLGQLSREIPVAPQVIEKWWRAALAGAEARLKKRSGDRLDTELRPS